MIRRAQGPPEAPTGSAPVVDPDGPLLRALEAAGQLRRSVATEPGDDEYRGAGEAGHEDHDAEDDGGGHPVPRAEPGRDERPCRHPLPGPQYRALGSTIAAMASNAIGSICDGGAVIPAVRAAIMNVAA